MIAKGGYQLLDYRDICDESVATIYNGYGGQFEVLQDTQAFTIAKNAITCGKPIILNNIISTAGETVSNFYMLTMEFNYENGFGYTASGFGKIDGEPTFIDITYNIKRKSMYISVNILPQ